MNNWKKYKIKEVIVGKPGNGLYKGKEFQGTGSRWLKMNEVFGYDFIKNQECEKINVSEPEVHKYGCIEGDILFCRTSLKIEGIGKCCYIEKVNDIPIYESNLFRIRPDKSVVDPKFLFYYFKSEIGRNKIRNISNQTAAASIKGSAL
jgi:type I restriction enzyme S subunit